MATVLSIQVGRIRELPRGGDRYWRTGFWKEPVAGPVAITRSGVQGDERADTKMHGGPDNAVLAYPAEHYPGWERELGRPLPSGGFGENLTVTGQTETIVFIGDIYRAGTALLQVSQPRQPCWKMARRWEVRDLAARSEATGRTGWYLRVLEEGHVAPGDQIRLVERAQSEWSVARALQLLRGQAADAAAMRALAMCKLLATNQRIMLALKVEKGVSVDDHRRLFDDEGG